jgi:hypothetical protein
MQLNRANPQPGRWRFVLLLNYYTSGNQTSLPFSAQIGFNTAQVSATGLPNHPGGKLSASAGPVVVPVTITNTSGLTQAFFADARLNGQTVLQFGTGPECTLNAGGPLLTELPFACFGTFLPTQMSAVEFLSQSTVPINMDATNFTGYLFGISFSPDLYAQSIGPNTVAASLSEPEIPWTFWVMYPSEIGPYPSMGAPTVPVATAAIAQLKQFDAAVSADSGDLWSDVVFGTNTYKPLVLAPGQTGVIHVTITPNPAQVGTTVRGHIYIDTWASGAPGVLPAFQNAVVQSGDEVVSLPYSYTIAP